MSDFYRLFIIVMILAVQHFLSTRNNPYWGIILPIAYIIFPTVMFVTNQVENTVAFILYLLLGEAFLIGGWVTGRKTLQEKRKKELEKMKTQDLK